MHEFTYQIHDCFLTMTCHSHSLNRKEAVYDVIIVYMLITRLNFCILFSSISPFLMVSWKEIVIKELQAILIKLFTAWKYFVHHFSQITLILKVNLSIIRSIGTKGYVMLKKSAHRVILTILLCKWNIWWIKKKNYTKKKMIGIILLFFITPEFILITIPDTDNSCYLVDLFQRFRQLCLFWHAIVLLQWTLTIPCNQTLHDHNFFKYKICMQMEKLS